MTTPNAAQRDFWNAGPGQRWAAFQADLDALHQPIAEMVVDAAAPRPGQRVLDIGCGAGATTLLLADRVQPGGAVLGLDISEPLVERARARIEAAGHGHVTLVVGDAQTFPAPEPRFDLAVSRFGLMFFDDPVAAFRNIAGLLRPGARLTFVTWASADHNPWFRLPARRAAERLGPAPAGDPDAPGPMAFRNIDRVRTILAEAGFAAIEARAVDTRLPVEGGVESALRLVPHVGPVARHMRDANGDETDLAAILDGVRADFEGFVTPEGLRIPARVNLFDARAG